MSVAKKVVHISYSFIKMFERETGYILQMMDTINEYITNEELFDINGIVLNGNVTISNNNVVFTSVLPRTRKLLNPDKYKQAIEQSPIFNSETFNESNGVYILVYKRPEQYYVFKLDKNRTVSWLTDFRLFDFSG